MTEQCGSKECRLYNYCKIANPPEFETKEESNLVSWAQSKKGSLDSEKKFRCGFFGHYMMFKPIEGREVPFKILMNLDEKTETESDIQVTIMNDPKERNEIDKNIHGPTIINLTANRKIKYEIPQSWLFYKGFGVMDRVIEAANILGIPKELLAIVEFCGQYYGVAFADYDHEVMFGSSEVWYRDERLMKKVGNPFNTHFKLPYAIDKIKVNADFWKKGVYDDMMEVDPNLKIYRHKGHGMKDITHYPYSTAFAILLGITFYEVFIGPGEWKDYYNKYFDLANINNRPFHLSENMKKRLNGKEIIGINIFKTRARITGGMTIDRRFW